MIDAAYRLAYRLGYAAMRQIWRIQRPLHHGAVAALWHDGRICLVRPSYRRTWELPGGGVRRGESAVDAVRRELREELGLEVQAERFTQVVETQQWRDSRRDHLIVLRVDLPLLPTLVPDNREIVKACFMYPAEARQLRLPRYLTEYLATLGGPALE